MKEKTKVPVVCYVNVFIYDENNEPHQINFEFYSLETALQFVRLANDSITSVYEITMTVRSDLE